MKRLLHVIPSANPATGGPIEAVRVQEIACQAAGLQLERELVTLDPPGSPYLPAFPTPIHAVGRPRLGGSKLRRGLDHWGFSPDLVPWLRRNARNYDAIIVDGIWHYSAFAASRVLPWLGVPYFVFPHGMLDPWFRKTYPRKHAAKQLFWLVGEGRLMANATAVLFTCEEEREQARGAFFGHNGYRGEVVDFGTFPAPPADPAAAATFRAMLPALGERPYLLFFSRIHRKKGCDLLIEAFARLAKAHPGIDLVIAGPDKTGITPELQALADARGISARVHWPGPVYGDAKWAALRGASAFVLSSHQENFGLAVTETLSVGTVALISDKVNIWREIRAGGGGLVEPDTIDGTERLLRGWLELSAEGQARMRANATALFTNRFNVEQTAPRLIARIEALIGER